MRRGGIEEVQRVVGERAERGGRVWDEYGRREVERVCRRAGVEEEDVVYA